jgi:ribose 5-phosphate isomerase
MKAELQELYEDLDNEFRNTDNQNLIQDSYNNVTHKLEQALDELDTLIGDVDAGVYNSGDIDDMDLDTLEVDD